MFESFSRQSGKLNIIFSSAIVIITILLLVLYPNGLSYDMELNYLNLLLSSVGYTIVIGWVSSRSALDIFSPFILVTFLHLMLYLIAPVHSILIDDTIHKAGVDVFDGCIEGTWLAFACYTVFAIFYEFYRKKYKVTACNYPINKNQVIKYATVIWGIGYCSTLIYLAMRGMSMMYIVFLGSGGDFTDELAGNSAYAFFSVIANLMFSTWATRYYYKPKSVLTWVMFWLTLSSLIVRGFRIFIIVLCLSPIIIYCLKNKVRPSMQLIIIVLSLIMVMIGIVGWARGALRSNVLLDFSSFSVDNISYAFWGNFDIYKTYYAVVNSIPLKHSYTYGAQMLLYTLVLFIPRALWLSKPQPPLREILGASLNDYAVAAGAAYPALGEWYHEFGIIGCIIFAAFAGILAKKLYLSLSKNTVSTILLYSVLFPSILQLVTRGYTPSNFWMVISMIAPIYIIKRLCRLEKF